MELKLFNDNFLNINIKEIPPINLVITSPPYNLSIRYDKWNDAMPYPLYKDFCKQWIKKLYDCMAPDGRIAINIPFSVTPENDNKDNTDGEWLNYPLIADYINIALDSGFNFWRIITWDKNMSNKTCWGSWKSARCPFLRDPSEAIIVLYKKQWKRIDEGKSTITGKEFLSLTKNLWKMHPETQSKHPAAFPLELPMNCMKLFSYENDWVMDNFMGSGTTGEAAMLLRRNFVGVEISSDYFKDAKHRIESAKFSQEKQDLLFDPVDIPDEPEPTLDNVQETGIISPQ